LLWSAPGFTNCCAKRSVALMIVIVRTSSSPACARTSTPNRSSACATGDCTSGTGLPRNCSGAIVVSAAIWSWIIVPFITSRRWRSSSISSPGAPCSVAAFGSAPAAPFATGL
jgi:hypothetical protein